MPTPVQRRTARSFSAGLVVFAILAVVFVLTFKSQSGMPFRTTTTVVAEIDDVHSLRVGDDVRANSKRIGRVSALDFDPSGPGHAAVTLELDGDVPVYRDATTQIWDVSALATKFVELDPGTPAAGPLGDARLPSTQGKSSADLYQVLDILDPATRAAATSTVRELGGGFAGHSADLQDVLGAAPGLLADAGTVSGALTAPDTDLPALLRSADQLTASLQDRDTQIADLVAQADVTLRAVTTDGGKPLQDTLDRAPGTLRSIRPALDALNQPLADATVAMTTVRPGAEALGASTPDLRGFLREAVPVAGQVPDVADQAVPAVEDLTHTVTDARPLAPHVVETLASLVSPLQVLAPYGPEIGQLFVRGASFVSEGAEPGTRFARLGFAPGLGTATGVLPAPNFPTNPYPAPGQDPTQRVTGGLPPGVPLLPPLGGGN